MASGIAATPAPVWGPAISIASLVVANVVALLLNPGLFRSSRCCGGGQRARPSSSSSPDATTAAVPTPRRCRCFPLPFFASNVSARAAAKQAGAAAAGAGSAAAADEAERPPAPLPRELWGFDVLSPRHALSSWLAPSSSSSIGGSSSNNSNGGSGSGADDDGWSPALWVLLPLHALTFAYFVMYVLLENLWSEWQVFLWLFCWKGAGESPGRGDAPSAASRAQYSPNDKETMGCKDRVDALLYAGSTQPLAIWLWLCL